jgi:uncharacterized protein YukJ
VVTGTPKDGLTNPLDPSRYEVKLAIGENLYFRVTVKIASTAAATIHAYYASGLAAVTKFNIPAFATDKPGYRSLETGMQIGEGLDYLRDDLFPLAEMTPVPVAGTGVSLTNLFDALVARAIHTEDARLIAFGQAFKNDRKPDNLFHHSPSWAMHDVHMMQGSAATPHDAQNRVYGDGAVFFWFPPERQLAALFIRYDGQSTMTDQNGAAAAALWTRP